MQRITVRPGAPKGWVLEAERTEPILFRSGAAAEASARKLARRLAQAGEPTETTILLRDGAVAGRFVTPAG